MARRQNFSEVQRRSMFQENAAWLQHHRVDGVEIADAYRGLRSSGRIYYCENCLFCHTEQSFFDVDHLVPDRSFRVWGIHTEARRATNMIILCKSLVKGDLGCNQSKGARNYVPSYRGLAFTRRDADMNYIPLHERPFEWVRAERK